MGNHLDPAQLRVPALQRWCTLVLLVTVVGLTGCSDNPTAVPKPTELGSFISMVRSDATFPDDDSVLEGVGEQVCYEITTIGYEGMRQNFAQSSFTPSQQRAIISAAERHLC